jgi:hypothetical protein
MRRTRKQILRLRALAAPVGLCAVLLCGTAVAAPLDDADPVSRLLAERGLMPPLPDQRVAAATGTPAPGIGLVEQARDRASDMVITAMNFLGVPYRLGGTDAATGFDCSGFTRHIFERSLGMVLPRRADEQASANGLINIARDELRPGDLVFFNTLRRTFSHVGIYVGEGKFIHAPRAGGSVRVEDMRLSYWHTRFTGARRAETTASRIR